MNRKFSVIIPTMLKCVEITNQLLDSLYEDDAVSEVIIVVNTYERSWPFGLSIREEKTRFYQPNNNIYVNPSWNLGVSLAQEDYIAILNDDITVPERVFSVLSDLDLENLGVIGMAEAWILETETPSRFITKGFTVLEAPIRNNGFGIFMAMHKSRYVEIPNEIKIWTGDDAIFHTNRVAGYRNGIFTFPIMTKMSATSNNPEFDEVKENDLKLYEDYKLKHGL